MANKIVHFEIMGPDGDQVKSFYEGLFDWNTQAVDGFDGYHMIDAEQSGVGGAVGKGGENMPQYFTMYVEVADVDAHLAKAEDLGGKTIMPKMTIPGMVTFGLFADPAGNIVGLVEEDTPAAG